MPSSRENTCCGDDGIVNTAGDGPLILFLHGFPEYWEMWKPMLEHFGARGWCAVAPDMRGYNLSEKPADVAAYSRTLKSEIEQLRTALGESERT